MLLLAKLSWWGIQRVKINPTITCYLLFLWEGEGGLFSKQLLLQFISLHLTTPLVDPPTPSSHCCNTSPPPPAFAFHPILLPPPPPSCGCCCCFFSSPSSRRCCTSPFPPTVNTCNTTTDILFLLPFQSNHCCNTLFSSSTLTLYHPSPSS